MAILHSIRYIKFNYIKIQELNLKDKVIKCKNMNDIKLNNLIPYKTLFSRLS